MGQETNAALRRKLRTQRAAYEELLGLASAIMAALCVRRGDGGTLRLPRRKGWGLSVFSLTDRCTGVCLRGVKYRLEDAVLTNRVPLGVSNEFAAPEAEISLTQGILMIAQTKK